TTREHLETLGATGFNRLSLGVQDFTPDVQEAVGRVQSCEETADLVGLARRLGFDSINIDLIYGLPLQTPAAFERTLELVVAMRPDRVAAYSYAHVPWLRGQQRRIHEEQLPGPEVKVALYAAALRAFGDAGYVAIGMDHFAVPEDEMGRAAADGTLWRNFMGYTVKHAPDMVACGVSGIGDVSGAYFQHERKLVDYERRVESGELPVARGWVLSDEDRLRRHVITSLMCTSRVRVPEVEERFGVRFWEAFAEERRALAPFERDGLARVTEDRVELVGAGRIFVRNVCMVFDAYRRGQGSSARFSRTV
ncbi:MAG: oxygen-independent coproporphyrinogen III oxidase, partial [Planctomycetota bacterium]